MPGCGKDHTNGSPTPTPTVDNTEITQWLQANLLPLESVEPRADDDFSDLLPLKEIIGDARVVGLGEATHSTKEFFTMKHRLVQFLVQEMGFNMFAMETNWPEAMRVNDYVLRGEGDPAQALARMGYWIWATQEVLDLVEWMRQHNQSGSEPLVSFYGFDVQSASAAMEYVIDYLRIVDPPYVTFAEGNYHSSQCLGLTGKRYHVYAADTQDACRARMSEVYDKLVANQERYTQLTSPEEYQLAVHAAEYLLQVEDSSRDTSDWAPRDRHMAENVTWLLDQAGPDAKMILWAHNNHVADVSSADGPTMGHHLRNQYGKDYVIIGLVFYEGQFHAYGYDTASDTVGPRAVYSIPSALPGSFGWYAHNTGVPNFILNLKDIGPTGPETAWLTRPIKVRSIGALYDPTAPEAAYVEAVPADAVDVVIYIKRSTPTQLLLRP